jgi:predicted SprT family Zn-dependent metalloprotease
MIKINQQLLREKFHEFNGTFFESKLKEPKFEVTSVKSWAGYFMVKHNNPIIKISTYIEKSNIEHFETLLHEMIHLWIWQEKIIDSGPHGYRFKQKMYEINRQGHHLTVSERFNISTDTLGNITYYIYVLEYFDTNKLFMFCINYSKLTEFSNILSSLKSTKRIKDFKLYSSRNTYFKGARQCTKRMVGNYINQSDIGKYNLISLDI